MSDERTPEQLEAQEGLQIAIEKHVQAFRSAHTHGSIEITGDWMLVAAVTSLDPENNERGYAYHLAFSGGEQPEHIAYGLLRAGEEIIREGEAKG